jgi:hypothetical protein
MPYLPDESCPTESTDPRRQRPAWPRRPEPCQATLLATSGSPRRTVTTDPLNPGQPVNDSPDPAATSRRDLPPLPVRHAHPYQSSPSTTNRADVGPIPPVTTFHGSALRPVRTILGFPCPPVMTNLAVSFRTDTPYRFRPRLSDNDESGQSDPSRAVNDEPLHYKPPRERQAGPRLTLAARAVNDEPSLAISTRPVNDKPSLAGPARQRRTISNQSVSDRPHLVPVTPPRRRHTKPQHTASDPVRQRRSISCRPLPNPTILTNQVRPSPTNRTGPHLNPPHITPSRTVHV